MTSLRTVLERAKELRAAQRAYMAHKEALPRTDDLDWYPNECERLGKAVAEAAIQLDFTTDAYERESKGATRADVCCETAAAQARQVERKMCALRVRCANNLSGWDCSCERCWIAAELLGCDWLGNALEEHGAPKR